MSELSTVVSYVMSFTKETENQYNQMIVVSKAVLSIINEMIGFVEDAKEKLETQMIQLAELDESLQKKSWSIKYNIDETVSGRAYYSEQYNNADSRDVASACLRKMEEARQMYDVLTESYQSSVELQKEIKQKKQKFEQLQKALSAMIDVLEKNAAEVKKLNSGLAEEITYNNQSLVSVLTCLQNYLSSIDFYMADSAFAADENSDFVSYSSVFRASANAQFKQKTYRLKSGTFDFKSGKRMAYRIYNPYAPQVREALYHAMRGLHVDFRDAIMEKMGNIILLNAYFGFGYQKDASGRTLKIIGLNPADPDFDRQILLHIGRRLYALDQSEDKLYMDKVLGKEIARNLQSADKNIQKIANGFSAELKGGKIQNRPNFPTASFSPSSRFFAQCFQAYAANDADFLDAVKSNFGESYRCFSEMMARLSNT